VLALGVTAFAQSAASSSQTTPSTTATQASTASSSDQQVTLTGCVQRESDYRSAKEKGRGGALGTGAGVGNEFILTDASMSSGASSMGTGAESSATGTSGSSSASGKDYELTGSGEGQAAQFVGKRVEVTGKLKAAEISASGKPTGGATAGTPPSGVDVASKDLKLRELDVTSVREASGTCPSSVK
jgi:hypothetical protein